jgi:hypothetical protein
VIARGGRVIDPMGVGRKERTLAAFPGSSVIGLKRSDPMRYAFPLGFAAMVMAFALPGSLLVSLGLYSDSPTDSILTKFHPVTYVAVLGAWFALYGSRRSGGMTGLFRERPALAWSFTLILLCIVYSAFSVGLSGVGVFVETYLAAALVAIALEVGTERQLKILGYTVLTFCVVNVAMSLLEGATQTHFLPMPVTELEGNYDQAVDEFRGQALYTHPLTGALVTSMALFMILGMRMRRWLTAGIFGFFIIGLMSFGGRGALATTLLMITAAALFQLASGLATGRLNVGFLGAFIAGVILLPALFVILTTMTDVGMRITSHLYLDDSADVRIVQWRVLGLLNMHDVLFGAPLERINLFKVQVGLTAPGNDIENPWLLTFLSLGVIGFPALIATVFLFMWHLGRRTDTPIGWLIIISTLLICSTSNSLGRKTPDLIFLAGIVVAMSGFRSAQSQAVATLQHEAVATPPPASPVAPVPRTALALTPRGRMRGLADGPRARQARPSLSGRGRA